MNRLLIISVTVLSSWVSTSLSGLPANISEESHNFQGEESHKDKFAVFIGGEDEEEQLSGMEFVLGESIDLDLVYKKLLIEMPLVGCDYYYGKHINATAGVNEVNHVPVLQPGDRVDLIRDGYLTMSRSRGYVSPGSGFLYASGVCWTTSAIGTLMDEANKLFDQKYQMPLFIFRNGDRAPHPVAYQTYKNSNYGKGYAIVKIPNGSGTDFSFIVNPQLKDNPKFVNLKIKIVMISSVENDQAFLGQSIGAYIQTNVDF